MVKIIHDINEYLIWLNDYIYSDFFSSPFCDEERIRSVSKKDNHIVYGVYNKEKLTGIFCLLVSCEEKSIETIFMYSKDKLAYQEFMEYLSYNYNGYEVWFVFNPKNEIVKKYLLKASAFFYTEQRFMEYQGVGLMDTKEVIPYCEIYKDEYIRLHSNDGYWSGEKVLEKINNFDIFLCVKNNKLVGYIDLSKGTKLVEIMDVMILPEYRNRGIGALLLTKAISFVGNKRLILTVDVDNEPANHLYEKMGFKEILSNNCITARMILGSEI